MPFNDLDRARIKRQLAPFIERRRPPAHLSNQLDLDYDITGQSIVLYFNRQLRDGTPIREHIGKTTFVKSKGTWKVYWMRADLKWHSYEPAPSVSNLDEWIALLDQDPHGCFWG